MKRKYSLNPKEFDIGGTEKYYSDMAKKGWKLVNRGGIFSEFEKDTPKSVRYRIEVVSPKQLENDRLPEEQVSVYEDCGWEYVTGSGLLHVFRSDADKEAPEFYLEPAQQAETLKVLRQRCVWGLISPFLYALIFTLLSFAFWDVRSGQWFAQFYQSWAADTTLTIGYLLVLAGIIFSDLWGTVYLSRLYRKMKQGTPLDHESRGKHGVLKWSQRAILLLGVVNLCWSFLGVQKNPMPLEPGEPYILLSELGVSEKRTSNYLDSSKESEIRHRNTLLSESWDTSEYLENQQWLYQEIYQLKSSKMMNQFVKSLMYNSTFAQSPEHFVSAEVAGLDQVWVTERLECIAVKGSRVGIFTHMWESQEEMLESLKILSEKWNREA